MRVQVVVQAIGPGVHQLLQPVRARLVLGLHVVGLDEQLHPQVAPDLRFPVGFCRSPLREEEVVLDPVEVVLGLRVHETEHRIRIGLSVDVRDPPVVAGDGDVLRLRLPGGQVFGDGCVSGGLLRCGTGETDEAQSENELFHRLYDATDLLSG